MKKILILAFLAISFVFGINGIGLEESFATNYLDDLTNSKDIKIDSGNGKENIQNFAEHIAKFLKEIFWIVATIYFIVIALRLIITDKTEEEISSFKKGILWISIGLVITQIAGAFVTYIYKGNREINGINSSIESMDLGGMANNLIKEIINPLILLLETGASFFFLLIAIFAFYRIITSAGDDEKAKTGKMSVLYAIIGFIIIKISRVLIEAVYKIDKNGTISSNINQNADISQVGKIIANIINWMNSFVGLFVIIMIILTGIKIIFSNGNEEKISQAKKSIIYIVIGVAILLMNYLILTFFLNV